MRYVHSSPEPSLDSLVPLNKAGYADAFPIHLYTFTFTTRRSQRKTLNSTLKCKRLKLKCDRQKPCDNCVKRDTVHKCVYQQNAADRVLVVPSVISFHSQLLGLCFVLSRPTISIGVRGSAHVKAQVLFSDQTFGRCKLSELMSTSFVHLFNAVSRHFLLHVFCPTPLLTSCSHALLRLQLRFVRCMLVHVLPVISAGMYFTLDYLRCSVIVVCPPPLILLLPFRN